MPAVDAVRRLSLRAKLTLCVALGVLAVVLAQTLLSVWLVRRDAVRSVMDSQSALIDHVARDIDQKLELRRAALSLDGAVIGQRVDPLAKQALEDHFATQTVLASLFDVLVVADRAGDVVFVNALAAQGKRLSVADRPYFQEVLRTGDTVISSPIASKASGRPIVAVAVPLRGADGEMSGVLFGLLYLDAPNFLTALGNLRIGERGGFTVFSKGDDPRIVMHAERFRVLQPAPLDANPYIRHALDDGLEATVEAKDLHGTPSIISYRSLSAVPWVVAAVYPTDEAFAAIYQREKELALIGAGMAAVAGLLIWLVASSLLRPLRQLQQAMVANRDRPDAPLVEVQARSADLAELARVYNDLMRHRGEAERALQASESRVRTITDKVPALIAYVDHTETYRFANRQYLTVFGIDPAAMVGRKVADVISPSFYAHIRDRVAAANAGAEQIFEVDNTGTGEDRHLLVRYVPDRAADGSVAGFYVMTLDVTERRHAEIALQQSRRRLVDITDNLPALVAYVDGGKRYRFANSKYRHWLGIDPQQMIGRRVEEAMSAEFYTDVEPKGDAALAGQHVRFERQGKRYGADAYYQVDFIPDVGADGAVHGFYALSVDITERRTAELTLLRSEQQLQQLTNSIPAMVGYFDMQQICQYANDTGLKSLGVSRQDVPGISMRDALGPSMYAQHEPAVREVLAGRRARLEGRTPFAGREAHFQAHLIPDLAGADIQRGFYLMTFDITAMKEAQIRQHRSEQQLRAITDNLPVLISYVDKEERFRFVNATFGAWTGIEPAAAIGQTVSETLGEAIYGDRREHIRRGLDGERQAFDAEFEAQGVKRQLHTVYIPDVHDDGHVSGFYSLSTDVTESREIERKLSSLARVDTLTALPNRYEFNERLPQAIARSRRSGLALAVLYLDVDHFKQINDGFGHATGDAVLREFALRLQRAVRETDTVARLSGDEFVAILEGLHSDIEARTLARKIVEAIDRPFHLPALEGRQLVVTTSLGIVFHEAGDKDGAALLAEADAALYKAKAGGRNAYHLTIA